MRPPVCIIQDEGTCETTVSIIQDEGHVGPPVSIIQDEGTRETTGVYNTG